MSETRKGAHHPNKSLADPKTKVKIGCWNVRTMFSVGKTAQVTSEMARYSIDILGISECRWSGFGRLRTQTGETIIYSGRDDDIHQSGVAIIMSKKATQCLDSWRAISDRIIEARFHSRFIKTTVIQVYAPTNEADEEEKDDFYEQLQKIVDEVPRHDMLLVVGDWNAKVGEQQVGEEGIVGKFGMVGERSDNGERMVSFCALNNLPIVSTMFPHKIIHRYTWTSPNGQHHNQIDHMAVRSNFKRSVQDVRAYRGADCSSDHNLVIAKTRLKLMRKGRRVEQVRRYETSKLAVPEIRKQFQLQLKNRFSCLSLEDGDGEIRHEDEGAVVHESEVEEKWKKIRESYCETAKDVLGYRARKTKGWISSESWKAIEERKQLKQKSVGTRSERLRLKAQKEYRKKDIEVKRSLRKDKREWANNIAREAEDAAKHGQMKSVYDATRRLCSEPSKRIDAVRNKAGKLLTNENEVRQRWKEHFAEILNRPSPELVAEVDNEVEVMDEIPSGPVTKAEIKSAINSMGAGKAPGVDGITVELFKADMTTTIEVLYDLFCAIWVSESIPADWKKGLIIKLPKKGDLTKCGNWRGITLMSVAAKVLGKVLIARISDGVDAKLRKEQAGFRQGRSTIEQIFVLRNIVEQAIEWNSSLYVCFVDYEKAFDSVDRETLWKIMESYGIPPKLIRMVKAMYDGNQCAVVDVTGPTGWFDVKSGVKQGCNMSGFLFLLVIDWIMRRTLEGDNTGIRWKLWSKLNDLDFADDIALLSSTRQQIQQKVSSLSNNSKATGLRINSAKTKLLRINTANDEKVQVDDHDIEEVERFVYLGAHVSTSGGTEDDIQARLGKARVAYNKLGKIWKNSQFTCKNKIKIFKSNVISVLLYGCETWRMTQTDEKKLDAFLHKSLRRMLKIYWPMRVTNEEIRRRTGVETISSQVARRRWAWLGHVLRMDHNTHPRTALTWVPEGKRKRGRPRETWRRTVERELKMKGLKSWAEAASVAADRTAWRQRVCSPILH